MAASVAQKPRWSSLLRHDCRCRLAPTRICRAAGGSYTHAMAARSILATIALLSWAGAAPAIDGIVLEIGEISMPDARIVRRQSAARSDRCYSGADRDGAAGDAKCLSRLAIGRRDHRLCARSSSRSRDSPASAHASPQREGPTKSIALNASAAYDIDEAALEFAASGLAIAGGHVRATGTLGSRGLAVHARASRHAHHADSRAGKTLDVLSRWARRRRPDRGRCEYQRPATRNARAP